MVVEWCVGVDKFAWVWVYVCLCHGTRVITELIYSTTHLLYVHTLHVQAPVSVFTQTETVSCLPLVSFNGTPLSYSYTNIRHIWHTFFVDSLLTSEINLLMMRNQSLSVSLDFKLIKHIICAPQHVNTVSMCSCKLLYSALLFYITLGSCVSHNDCLINRICDRIMKCVNVIQSDTLTLLLICLMANKLHFLLGSLTYLNSTT